MHRALGEKTVEWDERYSSSTRVVTERVAVVPRTYHGSFTRAGALVVVMSLSSAGAALAQDVPNRESALEIRKRYLMDLDTLQSKFLALAEAIPAEKYAWRPAPGVRSVGEAFMHVASEYYVYAPMAYGATRSPVIPARGPEAFKTFEPSRRSPMQ